MGTLRININKFLGTVSDVINMMTDVGLLSSHVFSYVVAQDMTNMILEERHLQALMSFLNEAKVLLNQLNSQLSHRQSKEGFEDILGFENRQSIVTDGMGSCNSDRKTHGNSFTSSCGTTSYTQMKNTSNLDVGFSSTTHQQFGNLSEARCDMSSGRFSPLDESQFNTADALARNRHYSVPGGSACYDMGTSSVGHENSLSSHGAAFNLPSHLVVNSHFQSNCESAFAASTNQLLQFPSCSRDTSMKQFSSAPEVQNHDSQYVSHDKSQDFSSKPSCEFAQPTEAGDSQHFTSPRGHFSPTAESNCETMYASRCETTQDAHFSCDTSYETSNHSGPGMLTFQTSSEQSLNPHYSHPSLSADTRFGDPSKNQHASAFSMVNALNSTQYSSCQNTNDKAPFTSNENAQNKMHFSSRNNICETSFPPISESNNFEGIGNSSCNNHVASREPNENRYAPWSMSDSEDFDPSSPVQGSQTHGNSFGDLQLIFGNQVDKNGVENSLKRISNVKDSGASGETSFSVLLGSRDTGCLDPMVRKKLAMLDGLKQLGGKWKCPLCAKLFIARINFERHFKVQHLGEKAFPCHSCDKGFSSKIRLDAHLMRQHNINCESAYPCSVCGKLFNTKTSLKTHGLTHVDDSEKPFPCNICNKRFSQKVVLDTHLLRHGGPDSYKHICKICSKGFLTKSKLKFHSRKHESAQFSCKECPKQFSSESLLRSHETTHLAFTERPFQCSQCPKTFTTKHKLQIHIETHASSNQYSCTECSAVFKCRITLVAHTRRRHHKSENSIPAGSDCSASNLAFSEPQHLPVQEPAQGLQQGSLFKCSECLKEFKRKKNLREHELSVHQNMAQRFACDQCPKRFKSKSKLKIHLTSHTTEPNLACRTCGKRFYRSDFLRSHEATHTGNKPFSCDVCARRFVTQSKLKSHQVIHQPPESSTEVPCPTCGKKFKNKRTLGLHVKCHADSLEFKCGTCGKQFARRVHFEGHMRTHSADRPYSCTVCNRTFRERKHRKDHMRRLHPNEILGGGEMTLQKLIDSITADDTMDAPTDGGSFETDVNSDALATLTELSNSGMQHLLEESSQPSGDTHADDTSQSQSSQINSGFGSQSRNLGIEPSVESVTHSAQVNQMTRAFSTRTRGLNLNCQTDLNSSSQVHLPEAFPSQPQSLSILPDTFQLKSTGTEQDPFNCTVAGTLSPLPELSNELQSMETCSHRALHAHYSRGCDSNKTTVTDPSDESLPKLSDVLAISM